ncbi:MAG: response regulator [Pseudanabaenaceae cyanobacterium SKYGB_i_bin29]|nr:response regulator [Pseudanabaenaceae cyanobacterium SKYG29]MDW8422141.1 response regulator [Pseudanabaenaceae cyanobacterium SKYGB_i_bin29]
MIANLPVGKVIKEVPLENLMVALHIITKTQGILLLETPHHRWRLIISGGSIALAEEEDQFIPTFCRKLRAHKVKVPQGEWEQLKLTGFSLCNYVSEVYNREPEAVRTVLREIQFENLLAITLENRFSLLWQPSPASVNITFPIWSLNSLFETVKNAELQWKEFTYVRHPFQKVQLIDDETTLVHVPLFAKVTTGQHRLTEIADEFKQSLTRTALRFDKLAERRLVAILPLTIRSGESDLDSDRRSYELALSQVPRIHLVDDSPVLLKQFGDLLTHWGYQVDVTENATLAIEKMLLHPPELIFLDINMPGLNGFELIAQIRRQPSLATIPIVLVTAESNFANSMRAKWAKCRFLAKPRSQNETTEFRAQLRQILQELVPLPSTETPL